MTPDFLPRGPARAGLRGNRELGRASVGRPPWHSLQASGPSPTLLQLPFPFGVFSGKQEFKRIWVWTVAFVMTLMGENRIYTLSVDRLSLPGARTRSPAQRPGRTHPGSFSGSPSPNPAPGRKPLTSPTPQTEAQLAAWPSWLPVASQLAGPWLDNLT